MPAMNCKVWPHSHCWGVLSAALLASGGSSRNTNGVVISKNSMSTKTTTATIWVAVEYFPVTRLCSTVR